MNTPMANDPELDALLGAYALDALDPDERAQVDDYVARNPRARDEVDELRESAASLALAPIDDATAPPGLWDRISATIADDERGVDRPVSLDEARTRRRFVASAGALLAVAASIAIVVLGARVVSLNNQLDDTQPSAKGLVTLFDRAKNVEGAREVALAPSQGAEVARVVLLPDGTGYLKNDSMKKLSPDETYQLWAQTDTANPPTLISAGILGSDPQAAAFKTAADVRGFVLTVEKAPGVVSSTQPAYASATLS